VVFDVLGLTAGKSEAVCLPKSLPALRTAHQAGRRSQAYEAVPALVRTRLGKAQSV